MRANYKCICYCFKQKTENGSPGNFPSPFYNYSIMKAEVLRLYCSFVDEERNRSYPLAKGQNGLNGLYAYFFSSSPHPITPPQRKTQSISPIWEGEVGGGGSRETKGKCRR